MTPRVKICGITSVEDALTAVAAGADAIGLVFYPPSPRYVSDTLGAEIVAAIGPFVTSVGLFVNEEAARVKDILRVTAIQLMQFHGDESEAYCRQFDRPYIKAIRMSPQLDPAREMEIYARASGYLFDAWRPGEYGGTGATFDWQRITGCGEQHVILAGGLTPDNIADAVQIVQPYAVDVSGGVESSPGKKDADLVSAFISAVKRGNSLS